MLTISTAILWFSAGIMFGVVMILTGIFAPENECGRTFGILTTALPLSAMISGAYARQAIERLGYYGFFAVSSTLSIISLIFVFALEDRQIGDNATWHVSKRIRQWIRAYNHAAKDTDEPRLIVHCLPIKSPWLNPIEPCWVHAKRAVCEPDGDLSSFELRRRLCAHCNTQPLANTFKV